MPKKSFIEEIYRRESANNLIIFCIYRLAVANERCTFEKLVQECFCSFPKVFSFSCLSKWPDSRKLDRPLRSLRKKKMIAGSPKDVFSLTKAGRKTAEDLNKIFNQKKLKI